MAVVGGRILETAALSLNNTVIKIAVGTQRRAFCPVRGQTVLHFSPVILAGPVRHRGSCVGKQYSAERGRGGMGGGAVQAAVV